MARHPVFPGGGNMQNLLRQAEKMQKEMQKIQEELETREVEASAGGGVVTVRATGKQDVVSIKIAREVVDPNDVAMLEDLVLSAVREALRKSREMVESEMKKVTGGMNLPGLM